MIQPRLRCRRPRISARVLRAYRQTHYQAAGVSVRIGRRCPDMDHLLESSGVREAAFITAYNPFSRRMPSGWNRRMQARLAETLRHHKFLSATGSWRGWSEDHLLVLSDVRVVCRVMLRYRQNGIVIVKHRQIARLVLSC
ncbi:MAG TPA: DUF3293 domain-containing protein [Rhodopila sp.]